MNKAERAQADGIVVVFSPEESCVQCNATYRALDAKGIKYRTISVPEDDEETRGMLRELGFMQFPIVWAPRVGYWAGFRPDKIGGIHRDVSQSDRDGMFWTRCSCGDEFAGNDPDDADAAAYEHCFPEGVAR